MRHTSDGFVESGDEYWTAYKQAVYDKSRGRVYDDGLGFPAHRLIVCVPERGASRRAGYRNGWLES